MQNSFLVCFTIWTSLLLGHLQSERLFLHCGAGYCMRCFMAGTWICSHSGGTHPALPLHLHMSGCCGDQSISWRICPMLQRHSNLEARLFTFLELQNPSHLKSLMTFSYSQSVWLGFFFKKKEACYKVILYFSLLPKLYLNLPLSSKFFTHVSKVIIRNIVEVLSVKAGFAQCSCLCNTLNAGHFSDKFIT